MIIDFVIVIITPQIEPGSAHDKHLVASMKLKVHLFPTKNGLVSRNYYMLVILHSVSFRGMETKEEEKRRRRKIILMLALDCIIFGSFRDVFTVEHDHEVARVHASAINYKINYY